MGSLDGIQEEIQRVAERVSNAVVGIGQRWGVGSGIVVGKDQVLTNAHNVRAEEVDVTFFGGRTATGRVAGADIDGDVAVLSSGPPVGTRIVTVGVAELFGTEFGVGH